MSTQKRKFISVYFPNGNIEKRKKKDMTISFKYEDPLYEKCKDLGSSKIKEIINVKTLKELKLIAKKEDRPLGNFIKARLRKHFGN
jgi:hypothetical protein